MKFTKKLIQLIEQENGEASQELLDYFFVKFNNSVEGFEALLQPSFKTYFLNDSQHLTIKEDQFMQGTTGMKTWSAALSMTEYFCLNNEFINGKVVLELGCGLGFLGLSCCVNGAKEVVLTDLHPDVLARCEENVALNKNNVDVSPSITSCDWSIDKNLSRSQLLRKLNVGVPEVVICTDCVYDPKIVVDLVKMFQLLIVGNTIGVVFCTIRQPETYSFFKKLLVEMFCVAEFEGGCRMFPVEETNIKGMHITRKPSKTTN